MENAFTRIVKLIHRSLEKSCCFTSNATLILSFITHTCSLCTEPSKGIHKKVYALYRNGTICINQRRKLVLKSRNVTKGKIPTPLVSSKCGRKKKRKERFIQLHRQKPFDLLLKAESRFQYQSEIEQSDTSRELCLQ